MIRQIVDLSAPDRPAPAVAALLAELNAFTVPRALRRWQRDVLETGTLRATWPLDGASLVCDATLWRDYGLFAYRFVHGPFTLWLLTGGCKTGWHIAGLVMLPLGLAFAGGGEDLALVHYHVPALAAVRAPQGKAEAQVVVGHSNFAHHLWNELPALAAARPTAITRTLVLWEPILPLDQLVDWPGALCRVAERDVRPPPDQLAAGVLLPLGSTRIPAGLAARVRAACAAHDVVPPGRPGAAALSLSLRSMYRRPINQLAFCRAVLARLPASLDVYLDGFAMPDDIDVPGRYDVAQFRAWQQETAALASELMAGAPADGPRLVDATLCTVPQAIALGARLDAYLSPHGTQQHKIGWVHQVPGVVHTSPHVAQSDQAAWLADQCEHHAPVAYLPAAMTGTVPGQGRFAGDPWYDDYQFIDVEDAVSWAVRALMPYIGR